MNTTLNIELDKKDRIAFLAYDTTTGEIFSRISFIKKDEKEYQKFLSDKALDLFYKEFLDTLENNNKSDKLV